MGWGGAGEMFLKEEVRAGLGGGGTVEGAWCVVGRREGDAASAGGHSWGGLGMLRRGLHVF